MRASLRSYPETIAPRQPESDLGGSAQDATRRPKTCRDAEGDDPSLEERVTRILSVRVAAMVKGFGIAESVPLLLPGKMLRTRFAACIRAASGADIDVVGRVCAAIEMAHTATLCHDDVIDNAFVRRSFPSLWRAHTRSAAILIGDGLLCQALSLVLSLGDASLAAAFADKINEVCEAECRQELARRGSCISAESSVRFARGKTGPLFAFAACVAAGGDSVLAHAAEEAGYCVGTAYQLADDLLDTTGQEEIVGKTLGTDRLRGKRTIAADSNGAQLTSKAIGELLAEAVEALAPWPSVQASLGGFLATVFVPLLEQHVPRLNLEPTAGMA